MFGFWLVDLLERDGVAERFELALQASGAVLLDRVSLALPIGSEVAVGDVVGDDAEARDEQLVADRPRSLFVRRAGRVAGRSARRGGCLWCARRRVRIR